MTGSGLPRRIVTGHSESGGATVWMDGPATTVKRPTEHLASILLWATTETPAPYTGDEDAGSLVLPTPPPANGTRFVCISMEPGERAAGPMHRTDSLDYVVCTEGVASCVMDECTVDMRAGDAMVQRGTNHVWFNGGDERAVVFIVLIDGHPKRGGSLAAGQEAK
jgi:mannose-6-phosphate isomerase-like protein (cupin superfamily)